MVKKVAGAIDERRPEDGKGDSARPHKLFGILLIFIIIFLSFMT
jgi:hypothetical protein